MGGTSSTNANVKHPKNVLSLDGRFGISLKHMFCGVLSSLQTTNAPLMCFPKAR